MRKYSLFLFLLMGVVSFGFVSCGDGDDEEKIDHGSVSLDRTSLVMKFDDEVVLTPTFSNNVAKNKQCVWSTTNGNCVSVKDVTGGKGQVKALRIGEAEVWFKSEDGRISAKCSVVVKAQSTLLNGIKFSNGESLTNVRDNWETNELIEEQADRLEYRRPANSPIEKVIYLFTDGKLHSTLVILKSETTEMLNANEKDAEQYLKERYPQILGSSGGIVYYDTNVASSAYTNTKAGIFMDGTDGITAKLGVKYTAK